MLLAIDTSTHSASLCLTHDRVIVASRTLEGAGRRHAQTLVQEAGQLLSEQSLKPRDLHAVAVSAGPGSFTGLRVGLVFAKTLAWLNHIPLLAVDTLQAIAQQLSPRELTPDPSPSVLVISDAQRNEVFACEYRYDPAIEIWQPAGNLRIARPAELSAWPVIAGPAVPRHQSLFDTLPQPPRCIELHPAATAVASIAHHLLKINQTANPATLEPIYVRPSYAEEKKQLRS
jgi:tRNA threonylcarbamoyladenosine biosynthesis protein TsaB